MKGLVYTIAASVLAFSGTTSFAKFVESVQ
jgi:hypothetical protein